MMRCRGLLKNNNRFWARQKSTISLLTSNKLKCGPSSINHHHQMLHHRSFASWRQIAEDIENTQEKLKKQKDNLATTIPPIPPVVDVKKDPIGGDGGNKNKERNDKEETKKPTEEADPVSIYAACGLVIFLWIYIGSSSDYEDHILVDEYQCAAKVAADKMPGTLPDCNHIQRVKMDKRVAIQLLTSMGIAHAGLEGNLWECKLKSTAETDTKPYQKCWYRQNYWNDEAAYELSPEGAEILRQATEDLHAMCLLAVEEVVNSNDLMELFEIPPNMREAVRESWRKRETDFLGRFDLMWDGRGTPKLAEYNADTPTILVETGLGQEIWFKHAKGDDNVKEWQFNDIEKNLKKGWPKVASPDEVVYLIGFLQSVEEREHLHYLKKIGEQVNIPIKLLDIADVEIIDGQLMNALEVALKSLFASSTTSTSALDSSSRIKTMFKLYPYEWLSHEVLGSHIFGDETHPPTVHSDTRIIEPAWKLILGNKAILALLWSMFPNHPNLLPAYFELNPEQLREQDYVSKPKYGREGQGILYSRNFRKIQSNSNNNSIANDNTMGDSNDKVIGFSTIGYESDGTLEFLTKSEQNLFVTAEDYDGTKPSTGVYLGFPVYQQHFDTARFSNRHIVIGSWVIGGIPSGFNFREDSTDTTQDNSCFVPHYIRGEKQDFTEVKGRLFNDRQRELYKELYGMEIVKKAVHGDELSSSPVSKPNNGRGESGSGSSGGGGGFFNWWNRGSREKESEKNHTGSSASGGHGSAGGGHGAATGSTSADPSKQQDRENQRRTQAENMRQKANRKGVYKARSGTTIKATGSSHRTVSRAGMGGGKG